MNLFLLKMKKKRRNYNISYLYNKKYNIEHGFF